MNYCKALSFGCAATLSLALAMPADAAGAAPPTVAFRFTGDCADCYDGAGVGTGTLSLKAGYQLGEQITADNFISFVYDGTDLQNSFLVTDANRVSLHGSINGPLPGTESFGFFGPDLLAFNTDEDGTWCVGYSCTADYGFNHRWAQVAATGAIPEPATWALMIVGFGAVGGAMRRRLQHSARLA